MTGARIRQNQKAARHGRNKKRGPIVRQRASSVLGKLLLAFPGVPALIAEIRQQFDIPLVDPGDDIKELLKPGQVRDWADVRREVEVKLRSMPDVLPPELATFQKMKEYRRTLPRTAKFTEPTTPKLRLDVRKLYKGFVYLFDLVADRLASPWEKAINGFFEAAADNVCEFLQTGNAPKVPGNWINVVQSTEIFGDKMVLVVANSLADPDEVTEEFREEFGKTFGKRLPRFTVTDVEVADYLRMRFAGEEYKDIVDKYIQAHRLEFPKDEQSAEYEVARRRLEDTLKHSLKSAERRLDAHVGD